MGSLAGPPDAPSRPPPGAARPARRIPRRARTILLASGGAILAAGTFVPEIREAAGAAFGSSWGGPTNTPWVVLRASIEDLLRSDGALSWKSAVYFAASAIGLAYPVLAGAAFAAAGLFPRSRAVAIACHLLHALAIWGLAAAALGLSAGILDGPGTEDAAQARADRSQAFLLCGVGAFLAVLGFAELAAAGWGARRRAAGIFPVDAVNLPPAALLLLVQAALFARLHAHPNWPAAGSLVGAVGALLAVGGSVLGLRPPSATR